MQNTMVKSLPGKQHIDQNHLLKWTSQVEEQSVLAAKYDAKRETEAVPDTSFHTNLKRRVLQPHHQDLQICVICISL